MRADTPEALADKIGVPRESLRHTIDRFNDAAEGGEFDPTRFDQKTTVGLQPPKSHWAQPLRTPPYEAVPVEGHICFTFGGLRVDGQSRVLDADGRAIAGLYAAGESAGVFYGLYPAGTSVLRSLTFGMIAGTVAAQAREASTSVPEGSLS